MNGLPSGSPPSPSSGMANLLAALTSFAAASPLAQWAPVHDVLKLQQDATRAQADGDALQQQSDRITRAAAAIQADLGAGNLWKRLFRFGWLGLPHGIATLFDAARDDAARLHAELAIARGEAMRVGDDCQALDADLVSVQGDRAALPLPPGVFSALDDGDRLLADARKAAEQAEALVADASGVLAQGEQSAGEVEEGLSGAPMALLKAYQDGQAMPAAQQRLDAEKAALVLAQAAIAADQARLSRDAGALPAWLTGA